VNRIDRFVEVLLERGAQCLRVAIGSEAELEGDGGRKRLTRAPLGERLVTQMLHEIAPPARLAELETAGDHAFAYTSPHGEVMVSVHRAEGVLELELTPGNAGSPEAAPAARPPVEAAPVTDAPVTDAPVTDAPVTDAPSAVTATPAAAVSWDSTAIDALLREMAERGCSDLHLSTNSPPLVRKDGGIGELSSSEPLEGPRLREMLYSITPDQRRIEFEECNDTDFAYEIGGVGRFRCNLFRDRHGVGGVFRVIPTEILTADQLGLPSSILNLCDFSKGLVVVTGPTGSGKSTTLAAMIDHINKTRSDHVITIEDPIEFVHRNRKCLINQREVGNHTAGFKPALRAALREDPDIVLVGEMRDLETIEIAIETAETGHLVFGTLHTSTAGSTVDRIIDQFPTDRQSQIRTMLASSLRGVVAQTLCKKVGGGRAAALEVLLITAAVSNLIREGKTFQIPSLMQTGGKLGMVTLNDALIALVQEAGVAPEEAYRRAVDPKEFARAAKAKGINLSLDPGDQPEAG